LGLSGIAGRSLIPARLDIAHCDEVPAAPLRTVCVLAATSCEPEVLGGGAIPGTLMYNYACDRPQDGLQCETALWRLLPQARAAVHQARMVPAIRMYRTTEMRLKIPLYFLRHALGPELVVAHLCLDGFMHAILLARHAPGMRWR
jgi:hypothetical protein